MTSLAPSIWAPTRTANWNRCQRQLWTKYQQSLLQSLGEKIKQRSLLSGSLWRIASDHLNTFLGEHSLSTPAYALGLAAVFAIGAGAIFLLRPSSGAPALEQGAPNSPAMNRKPSVAVEGPASVVQEPVETQQVSFEKPSP